MHYIYTAKCIQASHRDNALSGLHTGSRPGIKGKADSISLIRFSNVSNRVLHAQIVLLFPACYMVVMRAVPRLFPHVIQIEL